MLCILLMYLIPANRVKLKSSLFRVNKLISYQYCKVSLLCMTSAKKENPDYNLQNKALSPLYQ